MASTRQPAAGIVVANNLICKTNAACCSLLGSRRLPAANGRANIIMNVSFSAGGSLDPGSCLPACCVGLENLCLDNIDGSFFGILLEIVVLVYAFTAVAIVADEHLVVSLETLCVRWNVREDVAGASFMAFGSAAPEIIINAVSTIKTVLSDGRAEPEPDPDFCPCDDTCAGDDASLGIGAIIGSGMIAYAKQRTYTSSARKAHAVQRHTAIAPTHLRLQT